jgi:hypothetical protein
MHRLTLMLLYSGVWLHDSDGSESVDEDIGRNFDSGKKNETALYPRIRRQAAPISRGSLHLAL